MRRPKLTPGQRRKQLNAAEVAEFKPPTRGVETLRDQLDVGTPTKTGWKPPPHLSTTDWLRVGYAIRDLERAMPWLWGDWWLARGLRTLPADWDGPNQHTLDNAAVVSRAYTISRRRENVPFSHHAELAHLPVAEQDELLDWCAATRASLRTLREELRRRAAAKLPPPKPPPALVPPADTPPITPPPAAPLRIEPPESVTPLVVLPTPEPEIIEPPPRAIGIPVTVILPSDLHAWAVQAAADERLSLPAWVRELVQRARDAG